MQTVKSLRDQGYSVRVYHIRKFIDDPNYVATGLGGDKPKQILSATGGSTDVTITTPTGETVREVAHCCDLDGYNKKRGVRIALGRAMKQLNSFPSSDIYDLDYTPDGYRLH